MIKKLKNKRSKLINNFLVAELHEVSDLLQIEAKQLQLSLQSRSVDARGEEVVFELPAVEAARGRNILCRALYNRLFSWIVNRINEALKVCFLKHRSPQLFLITLENTD